MRSIPDPGFAGDDGSVSAAVAKALAAHAAAPDTTHSDTLAVLQHARLLVPVVAVLGEVEYDEQGLAHDKTSDMATVLLTGQDGRKALLAFTGRGPLERWDADARPVPVTAARAAEAARQDGADAIVVDVAGPTMFVVEGEDLQMLASGASLLQISGRYAWVRPAP